MAVVGVVPGTGPPAVAAGAHRPPVDGRVLRPFAAPAVPFGAGHRGVDLEAAPGTPVRASAAGTVAYAGVVARRLWVAVEHPDGVRTTYGPLAAAVVVPGQDVAAGATLGRAAGSVHGGLAALHWGAQRDGSYVDPLGLVGGMWRPTLVGPGGWEAGVLPAVPRYGDWEGQHRYGFVPGSTAADGPGWITAPNPNHVVGIAGLGSASGEGFLDLAHLGFAAADVSYHSYAGLAPSGVPVPYGPEDTWRGVVEAAHRLRQHLRERWRRAPGQAVDLVGHSMGGAVALYYLLVLHDPADPALPPIGHVATVASPVDGSDIADLVLAVREDPARRLALDAAGRLVPDHDPAGQAVADLATESDVIAALSDGWLRAIRDPAAGPLATGTQVFTFGASRDLVVPEHRSDLPEVGHVVLPGTHGGVLDTEAVRIALREFLADRPVPGEPGGIGHGLSHVYSLVDEVFSTALWLPNRALPW